MQHRDSGEQLALAAKNRVVNSSSHVSTELLPPQRDGGAAAEPAEEDVPGFVLLASPRLHRLAVNKDPSERPATVLRDVRKTPSSTPSTGTERRTAPGDTTPRIHYQGGASAAALGALTAGCIAAPTTTTGTLLMGAQPALEALVEDTGGAGAHTTQHSGSSVSGGEDLRGRAESTATTFDDMPPLIFSSK